jgi:hypothetical protein
MVTPILRNHDPRGRKNLNRPDPEGMMRVGHFPTMNARIEVKKLGENFHQLLGVLLAHFLTPFGSFRNLSGSLCR